GSTSPPTSCDAPAPDGGAPPAPGPGGGAGHRTAGDGPAGAGAGGPGADLPGTGPLPATPGVVVDHLLPGVELRGTGDDVRLVDRLRLRLEDPQRRLPAGPLRGGRVVPAAAVPTSPVGAAAADHAARGHPGRRGVRPAPGPGPSAD